MRLFSRLGKRSVPVHPPEPTATLLYSPVKGTVIPMSQIPDEIFSLGVLGSCCGIQPIEGLVYAPLDGTITHVSYGYSIGIHGTSGVDVMIHAGVDTIMMRGVGFSPCVQTGDFVRQGQLLMKMDLSKIAAAGHPTAVITVVSNSDQFQQIEPLSNGYITPTEPLLRVLL